MHCFTLVNKLSYLILTYLLTYLLTMWTGNMQSSSLR